MSILDSPIGYVPIVWNNVDLAEGSPLVPAETVLDEVARLGTQLPGDRRGLAGGARGATPQARRRRDPALGDQRHRAVLQHLEVALDALPALVAAFRAR